MKILQVIAYFNPIRGGDVNVCYNLSKELVKRGHQITILTTDFEYDESYAQSLEGVQIIPCPCIAHYGLFLYTPAMKEWLKTNLRDFDIIHLHNFRSYQSNIVYEYAKSYKIPYILQAHGSLPRFIKKRKLKIMYDYVWGNQLIRDAFKFIALTNSESNQYQNMGADKKNIEIIPNGVDLSQYANLPQKNVFRSKYHIGENEKIILYIGRLHESKGLDLLLKAFNEVTLVNNNVYLALVGPDDGYLATLHNLVDKLSINKNVIFTGFVSSDEKIEALVDANVFITPSFSGFPVSFLEACICGKPIITTNHSDDLDWLSNKVGYSVNYDTISLSNAIIDLLGERDTCRIFGEEGKRLVLTRFNWEAIVINVEKIYQNNTEQ